MGGILAGGVLNRERFCGSTVPSPIGVSSGQLIYESAMSSAVGKAPSKVGALLQLEGSVAVRDGREASQVGIDVKGGIEKE